MTRLNPRDATFERLATIALEGPALAGGAGTPILVAVSGGPDSMALLHFMLGWARASGTAARPVVAAHVNHALRGKASDEEAAFVRAQAEAWGTRSDLLDAEIPATARGRAAAGRAIEAEARRARYRALAVLAARHGADRVFTAHTADDQAETVLLRLVRGAGLRGTAGMAARSRVQGVRVVRPLLRVTREQVLDYVSRHSIPYREDASNAATAAARNYVRHEILPRLEARLNPAARDALLRAAASFREADAYLERRAARIYRKVLLDREEGKISLDAAPLLLYPKLLRTYVFRRAVRELNGNLRDVAAVHLRALHELSTSSSGHRTELPGGILARRERDRVTLERGPLLPRKAEPGHPGAPSKA
jgi:tRNA(Ile)-lysidine synthetase-like protein